MGMVRRDTERLATIDNILAKAEGQRGDALLSGLVADGVVVQRTQHAGESGVVEVTVLLAYDFLEYDGHFLLVDDVLRGGHISLRVAVIDRGIDGLDGTGQLAQHLVLVVQIGNHIGGVDAGEGLIVTVLQQRRGTHGDRTLHGIKEGEEVGNKCIGKLCL